MVDCVSLGRCVIFVSVEDPLPFMIRYSSYSLLVRLVQSLELCSVDPCGLFVSGRFLFLVDQTKTMIPGLLFSLFSCVPLQHHGFAGFSLRLTSICSGSKTSICCPPLPNLSTVLHRISFRNCAHRNLCDICRSTHIMRFALQSVSSYSIRLVVVHILPRR